MAIVGATKQEEKLNEMAKVAKSLFPDVDEMAVKGALRFGIKGALQKTSFANWMDVFGQSPSVRKTFFNTILQEAKPHLEAAVGLGNVQKFIEKMAQANEKYVTE